MTNSLAIKHSRNGGTDRVENLIRNREPFKVASVMALSYAYNYGLLRGATLTQFRQDVRDGVDYVIYSYATPIAWHRVRPNDRGASWIVNQDKYSLTTTQHQSRVRSALAGRDSGWEDKVARPAIQYQIAGH